LHVKFANFSGGNAPDPQTGEGLRRPSPDPTSGASLVPSAPPSPLGRLSPQILRPSAAYDLLSCTVSKLWLIIGQIFASVRGEPHFDALARVTPSIST